jgi:hypothetical protein
MQSARSRKTHKTHWSDRTCGGGAAPSAAVNGSKAISDGSDSFHLSNDVHNLVNISSGRSGRILSAYT